MPWKARLGIKLGDVRRSFVKEMMRVKGTKRASGPGCLFIYLHCNITTNYKNNYNNTRLYKI